mmetsp:Transcript_13363/g.25365  ORF Transcript_13363/g.25365 Transcript_13363/m.25365 type:complete len:281 (-) Transcript_13363:94-936(-)|eukprot:scaffold7020_cov214-Amphora_coffeaeformis.AAC.1
MSWATTSNHKDEETPAADTTQHPKEGTNRWTKLLLALFLVGFILFVVLDSTIGNGWILGAVEAFLEWIEDNPIPGIFVFIVVYFVATIIFIPGSILTLGAGFVFASAFGLGPGVLLGSLAVFFGASSGATAAFLLGRFLLRDWVSRKTEQYTIFEALDNALAEKGFRIMALLRLSPIIPFNVLNYIAGVTAIGFWQYMWAMFAILPGTILYVFLGASAGSLADSANSGDNSTITIVVVVVGIMFGVLAVALTSYYARQELRKVTEQRDETTPDEEDGEDS